MKKALSKLPFVKKKSDAPEGRITTDTIAEHREQVLAGGRRFKYPVQYARHKLVINAVLIGLGAVVSFTLISWWQLYLVQNTGDFMYRLTKIFPVSVAEVDGEEVRYSDYLMRFRSSVQYLVERDQININDEDGKQRIESVKRRELDGAIADAYAAKLAREQNISVSDAEIEAFLVQQRTSSEGEVSEATYNAVILDYYGWSPAEYRQAMKAKLLRQKVAYAVDGRARELSEDVEARVRAGTSSLSQIADQLNAAQSGSVVFTPALWVPRDNQDGGLAAAAAALQKGQVSEPIQTAAGNGYYIVKLVDSNDSQVQYEYIRVPLTEFSTRLSEVISAGKVREFITIQQQDAGE